jgi:hypothetical protein
MLGAVRWKTGAGMGDAAYDDRLGPDATRVLPIYRKPGQNSIRYASSAAAPGRRTTSAGGVPCDAGVPGGSELYGVDWVPAEDAVPRDDDDRGEADWSVPGPQRGWFGRRHPDLLVFGGGVIAAAAAMIVAFAAASGATATGYTQTSQGTATHAPAAGSPAAGSPAARAGAAPAAGAGCVSVAPSAASR